VGDYLADGAQLIPFPSQDGQAILMSIPLDNDALAEPLENEKPALPEVVEGNQNPCKLKFPDLNHMSLASVASWQICLTALAQSILIIAHYINRCGTDFDFGLSIASSLDYSVVLFRDCTFSCRWRCLLVSQRRHFGSGWSITRNFFGSGDWSGD
jgi:hypothetical protein